MGIISTDELNTLSSNISSASDIIQEPETPERSFGETFKANFKLENSVYNAAKEIFQEREPFDPNFDPFDNIEGYEEFASEFIGDNGLEDITRTKQKIDSELEARRIRAESTTFNNITTSVIGGILDPLNFYPVYGAVKAGVKLGQVGAGLASGALYGSAFGTVREGILQASQVDRSALESSINIATETALAAILGGGVGFLAKREYDFIKADFQSALEGTKPRMRIKPGEPLSSGFGPKPKTALLKGADRSNFIKQVREDLDQTITTDAPEAKINLKKELDVLGERESVMNRFIDCLGSE